MAEKKQASQNSSALTRRHFIQHTTVAALAAAAAARPVRRAFAKPVSANDKIGVGVIGTGGRGNSHLQVLKHMAAKDKNIEIVAVCDVYRPRMEKAAKEYNAKGYMDHRELLNDPRVDLVSIATPDHHHGYQAIDAVRAGKHVYCEKPVTHWRQFDLTKQLAEEVKKSGKTFQLGTQGMSDGAWHQMKKMVQDGMIGQPIHAECGFFRVGDWGERGMAVDDPNAKEGPDLNWEAFLGDSPKRPFDVSRFFRWRMYEDYAGGPVTDLFPHSLTPVTSILGVTFPSTVVATGGIFRYSRKEVPDDFTEREIPDTFNMLIDYPEKLTIAILGTQANDYQATGARGSGQKIPVIRGWDGTLTIEGEEIVFSYIGEKKKEPKRIPIEHGENMLDHYQNLVQCAREGRTDTYSPVDLAYYTQTPLIMGMWSLREGKVAKFDAEKQTIIM